MMVMLMVVRVAMLMKAVVMLTVEIHPALVHSSITG